MWQNTSASQCPRAQKVLSNLRDERAASIQRTWVQVVKRIATIITQGPRVREGGIKAILYSPVATGKCREAKIESSRVGENPAKCPLRLEGEHEGNQV